MGAEVGGAVVGGAVLAAIRIWAAEGPGRASVVDAVDRALDAAGWSEPTAA